MSDPFEQLRERMAALADLRNVAQLLDWDQQTMMPPGGAPARAETVGHRPEDQPRDVRLGRDRPVDRSRGGASQRRSGRFRRGVAGPGDQASMGEGAPRAGRSSPPTWRAPPRSVTRPGSWRGRPRTSPRSCPYLERNFELVRRYIDCFDELRLRLRRAARRLRARRTHERGRGRLFDELKAELRPMIADGGTSTTDRVDDSLLLRSLPGRPHSGELVSWLLELMGFDRVRLADRRCRAPVRHRLQQSRRAHHHALGRGLPADLDVRRDARMRSRSVRGGHRAVAPAHAARPRRSRSALHESQSRLWENLVGRGRPFCGVLAPRIVGTVRSAAVRARRATHCTARSTGSRPR